MCRGAGRRLLLDRVGDRVLHAGEERDRCDGDGAAHAGGRGLLWGDGAHAGRAASGKLHRRWGQGNGGEVKNCLSGGEGGEGGDDDDILFFCVLQSTSTSGGEHGAWLARSLARS